MSAKKVVSLRRTGARALTVTASPEVCSKLNWEVRKAIGAAPRGGVEIGGLLIGTVDCTQDSVTVRISEVELVAIEYQTGPLFHLTDADRNKFREWIDRRKQDGVIGLLRSDRRQNPNGPEPDAADRELAKVLFPTGEAVFTFCTSRFPRGVTARVFHWKTGEAESRCDVEWNATVTVPPPADLRPVAPDPPSQRLALETVPAQTLSPNVPARVLPAESARVPAKLSMPWLGWAVAGAVLAAGLAGAAYWRRPLFVTQTSGDSVIGMQIDKRGDSLLVSWDRNAPPVQSAMSGTLQVDEGGRSRMVYLTSRELRSGQLLYKAGSGNVRMELALHGSGPDMVQSILVVGEDKPEVVEVSAPASHRSDAPVAAVTAVSEEPPPAAENFPPQRARTFTPPPVARSTARKTAGIAEDPPLLAMAAGPAVHLPDFQPAALPDRPQSIVGARLPVPPKPIRTAQPSGWNTGIVSRQLAIQGGELHQVDVEVTISPTGKVTGAKVVKTTGASAPVLVPSALQAAMRWAFSPAMVDGHAVGGKMVLSFRYTPHQP